jgi:ribose transport system substrate-binding protein
LKRRFEEMDRDDVLENENEKEKTPEKVKEWREWYKQNRDFGEIKEIVDEKGLGGFADKIAKKMDRRNFIKTMGFATAGLTLLGSFPIFAQKKKEEMAVEKKIKAAYSAAGLAVLWVKKGVETFQHLGAVGGFDFEILDSNFDVSKQRSQIDLLASKANEYDVVFIHPNAIGAYAEPVKELISKGVAVVDIDTLLVPDLSTLDILTFTEPDNIFMGMTSTEYMCKRINYKGNVVHTQGALTHTGAQGRAKGFHMVVKKYPNIKVIDETPANWSAEATRKIWDDLIVKYDRIDGGFFHNDDMALAAYASLQAAGRAGKTILCGVDATGPALRELKKGHLNGTVFNPPCRVHGYAFWAAWFHLVNKVQKSDIVRFIRCDGPQVTEEMPTEVIDSYIWSNEHFLI